jgi:hypothetical protein
MILRTDGASSAKVGDRRRRHRTTGFRAVRGYNTPRPFAEISYEGVRIKFDGERELGGFDVRSRESQ